MCEEGLIGAGAVSSVTHWRTTYMLFSQEVHDLKVNMPGYTHIHCRSDATEQHNEKEKTVKRSIMSVHVMRTTTAATPENTKRHQWISGYSTVTWRNNNWCRNRRNEHEANLWNFFVGQQIVSLSLRWWRPLTPSPIHTINSQNSLLQYFNRVNTGFHDLL